MLKLLTSEVNGHQHLLRIESYEVREGGAIGGTLNYASGDVAKKPEHGHPWVLTPEGKFEIGINDGHSHEIDQAALTAAMLVMRANMAHEIAMSATSTTLIKGMRKAKRRLKNAKITTISLCRRGANGIHTILKSATETEAQFELRTNLSKMSPEGILHAIVYRPDAVDLEGDIMDAEEIRRMAHDFLPNGGHIDIEHDGKPLSKELVHIAEHYIITSKDDPKFQGIVDEDGNPIDPTGAWGVLLKFNDPALIKAYAEEDWRGVSMFGRAQVEQINKAQPSRPTNQEKTMTPEEMTNLAGLVAKAVADAIAPPKKDTQDNEPVAKQLPAPPADLNDIAVLEKYLDDLFVANLDLTKQSDVEKLLKHRQSQAAKRAAEAAKQTKSTDSKDTSTSKEGETELEKAKRELAEAQERLAKLEKASNQPSKKDESKEATRVNGLRETEAAQWSVGADLAKRVAKSNLRAV